MVDEYEEVEYQRWFLPKGRKDLGESLEDAAVREGYEEVGLLVTRARRFISWTLH